MGACSCIKVSNKSYLLSIFFGSDMFHKLSNDLFDFEQLVSHCHHFGNLMGTLLFCPCTRKGFVLMPRRCGHGVCSNYRSVRDQREFTAERDRIQCIMKPK